MTDGSPFLVNGLKNSLSFESSWELDWKWVAEDIKKKLIYFRVRKRFIQKIKSDVGYRDVNAIDASLNQIPQSSLLF